MKKFISFLLIIAVFLLACGGGGQEANKLKPGTKEYKLAEKISKKIPKFNPDENNVLASTNNTELTTGQVVSEMYSQYGDRVQQLAELDSTRLTGTLNQAITQIAVTQILSKQADDKGIEISEGRIDSLLQQQYKRVGGREKFKQQLSQRGMSEKSFRSSVTENLKIEEFFNSEIENNFQPSQEEIQKMYNQQYKNQQKIGARHILIREKDSTQQGQGLQQIKEIKQKIDNGADFAEMAKQHSEGPSSSKGGDLGTFGKNKMSPRFTRAAFALGEGEVSDVVKTRFGYHIIKVYEKKTSSTPLEEVRSEIVQKLSDRKKQQARKQLIQELKEEVNLEINI